MRVANKYFKPENARIVVVGKGSDVLENLEKTGIFIKYFDTYANPVEKPNYAVEMPADMSATKVFENYIEAVGGKQALENVKTVHLTAEAPFQGMVLNLDVKSTDKNQALSEVTAMGQSFMKSVVNGDSGYMIMQGQRKELTDEEIKVQKTEAVPFPELNYLNSEATLEKIENVDGENAYKINVGDSKSIYYSVDTGLKIKQTETSPMGSQDLFYSDYQKVGDVMFPFQMIQTAGPQKFEFKVKEIKVNEGVSDADFN